MKFEISHNVCDHNWCTAKFYFNFISNKIINFEMPSLPFIAISQLFRGIYLFRLKRNKLLININPIYDKFFSHITKS
jgi:hypothetical protein